MTEQEFEREAKQWRPLLAQRAARWSARLGLDTDDIVQEALYVAWRYRQSYRPDKGGYGTFFLNCLRSACSRLHIKLQSKERWRLLRTCPLTQEYSNGETRERSLLIRRQMEQAMDKARDAELLQSAKLLALSESLSVIEREFLCLMNAGKTLDEICGSLGKSRQWAYDVQSRIQKKARKAEPGAVKASVSASDADTLFLVGAGAPTYLKR